MFLNMFVISLNIRVKFKSPDMRRKYTRLHKSCTCFCYSFIVATTFFFVDPVRLLVCCTTSACRSDSVSYMKVNRAFSRLSIRTKI